MERKKHLLERRCNNIVKKGKKEINKIELNKEKKQRSKD